MTSCEECGAALQPGAAFCVSCGTRAPGASVLPVATATLTGSGLTVALATAAICAAIAAGIFVLVRSLI